MEVKRPPFFINEILLPDSSGYKLRTAVLLLFKHSTDSRGETVVFERKRQENR